MNTPTLTGTYTCTHHNDAERTACPVCLVTALTAERDELRAEVERLRSDRDCEKRLRKDAEELREDAIARAEKSERAETVALANWNGALERALKAEAERDHLHAQLRALTLICGTNDANKFETWVDRANARAERAEAELAAERARLQKIALDACRSAQIKPLVWYPKGYVINPNDLGKINEHQVEACVAALDAALKGGAK
jgi:hypothetical protein